MANYTIELYKILEKEEIFDFDFKFYNEDLKEDFKKEFINYFYFREIGFETVARFKKMLQIELNNISDYYTKLYKTELESQGINFLLNKDLTEKYIKTNDNDVKSNEIGKVDSSNTTNTNTKDETDNKNYDMPQQSIKDYKKYITSEASSIDNQTSNLNSIDNSTNENSSNLNSKTVESYILESKGNIGVTSSATLLQMYRDVIISINQQIFKQELEGLFMQIM